MYYAKEMLDQSSRLRKQWEDAVRESVNLEAVGKYHRTTISGIEIKDIYTPEDLEGTNFARDIGYPGEYPFLRGNQATGYRGKYWTFRMLSGMGTAAETNQRWHRFLMKGQTGLSAPFDFPTLMGYDSDSPRARGECGRCGVSIDTLEDFLILLDGIPMDRVTTSLTINPPATVIWAMYCAVADLKSIPLTRLAGTIQNDMLKEFIAQKTLMCPLEPSIDLVCDAVAFGVKHVPGWNTISISGYHIREAGATAVQELAFTLCDGIEYVTSVMRREGLEIDAFAPRLSFYFNVHIDFFEEIAKLRAARRMWAKIMRKRFKAKNPRSWWMRFHTQTAGCSLTAQQPYNNLIRIALQALAAVLGGTQSLHTNSLCEVMSLPSDDDLQIALRTQQIIAEETGVANTIDPLAGSYFVETLTNELEQQAWDYIHRIDQMGGMAIAIENGFPQLEIADAAYRFQKQIDSGASVMIGMNKYVTGDKVALTPIEVEDSLEIEQIKRLHSARRKRDSRAVKKSLKNLEMACRKGVNVMPFCIEAVKNVASVQEICDVYRDVYGEYHDRGLY